MRCDYFSPLLPPRLRPPAVATLTYAYADQTAVVGPLAEEENPHSWDLCATHRDRISAPVGWELVRVDRIELDEEDDLMALAEAVKEDGRVTTGLVDDRSAGSGADPIDYSATFDGADPANSNHPVFRTRRVAYAKRRAARTFRSCPMKRRPRNRNRTDTNPVVR